ncbi:uncharacterized protein LOC128265646 [Drosophila gunungcola]|uniref:uncharacterized protein LOC128265646 n=1 Tax=Drosophila gunungcola TaxID=103775 RepID=UPI0022E77D78|nr:uncharacterized protein LOC128265646 [Drosophila gunungcola]
MLFYDHLQLIQKSKDEHEARNQREKIRNKLVFGVVWSSYREIARLRLEKKHIESKFFNIKKEHCDQMNQLISEYEANLADELAACDHTISELKKKSLRRSEDVVEELSQLVAEKSAALANEDGFIGELRIELGKLSKLRMHHRLEEAHIAFLVGELKEAREHIVNLQQRQDFMDKGVIKKDLVIDDLKLQMRKLEDHKNFLNMQVSNALKQHADFDELNEKYRNAMMQTSEVLPWTYCLVEWGSSCVATGDTNDTSTVRLMERAFTFVKV